jgi:quinol monooxygenase YgiN
MFAVIYSFQTKSSQETKFEESWKALTELIYAYEGSLGSRLHKQSANKFIAYAQWPDKETWQNSGDKLPETAIPIRQAMKESCEKIETLHELYMTEDLLKNEIIS